MKNYLVFAYDLYYPTGGWDDFIGAYDTMTEAQMIALQSSKDIVQIVNQATGDVVEYSKP